MLLSRSESEAYSHRAAAAAVVVVVVVGIQIFPHSRARHHTVAYLLLDN